MNLYVHLTDDALRTNQGVARVEGIGPVTTDQIRDGSDRTRQAVIVKPVIDLAGKHPSTPTRSPTDSAKPSSSSPPPTSSPTPPTRPAGWTSTTPSPTTRWPPGQTAIGNLAPMTRFHHRIKTHGRWKLTQPFPGIHIWQTPHGRHLLVDHTGTTLLGAA